MSSRAKPLVGLRRAPYGDNPELGRLGIRSRAAIMAAARTVLAEKGYQDTSVEEIAARAGRAPAAVYQYFSGKDAIFYAFVQELGSELIRHASRLGQLGPDNAGFDELRMWIAGLGLIFRRHVQTFQLWACVDAQDHALEPSASAFTEEFVKILIPRLPATLDPIEARGTALMMLAVTDNAHTLVGQGWACDEVELTDTLARIFQLSLFPEARSHLEGVAPPWPTLGPKPYMDKPFPTPPSPSNVGLRKPVGPRAQVTVDHIVSVCADLIARRGLSGTSIADVAIASGMNHTRIYTYWANLDDLAATVSASSRAALMPLISSGLEAIESGRLTDWIELWFEAFPSTAAGIRLWQSRDITDPRIQADREAALAAGTQLLGAANAASDIVHLTGPNAGPLVGIAVLQLPMQAMLVHSWDDGSLETSVAGVLARGMLAHP